MNHDSETPHRTLGSTPPNAPHERPPRAYEGSRTLALSALKMPTQPLSLPQTLCLQCVFVLSRIVALSHKHALDRAIGMLLVGWRPKSQHCCKRLCCRRLRRGGSGAIGSGAGGSGHRSLHCSCWLLPAMLLADQQDDHEPGSLDQGRRVAHLHTEPTAQLPVQNSHALPRRCDVFLPSTLSPWFGPIKTASGIACGECFETRSLVSVEHTREDRRTIYGAHVVANWFRCMLRYPWLHAPLHGTIGLSARGSLRTLGHFLSAPHCLARCLAMHCRATNCLAAPRFVRVDPGALRSHPCGARIPRSVSCAPARPFLQIGRAHV